MLYEVQRLAQEHAALMDKLGLFASLLIDQAFAALLEFRHVREDAKQNDAWRLPDRPYPWPDKLTQAIDEAGRFLSRDATLLDRTRAEFRVLGEKLMSRATVPFRDAHLKNRIVSIIPEWSADGWQPFLRWLDRVPPEEMADWLRVHTTDIDFETADCLVTPWDDPLHILTSPNLGIDTARPATDGLAFLTRWGCAASDPDGQRTLTATLLCRTFRELCRRAWYAEVMPRTYRTRYRTEKAGYFLDAARAAAAGRHDCDAINELLATCQRDAQQVWPDLRAWDGPVRVIPSVHSVPHAARPWSSLRTLTHQQEQRMRILFLMANPIKSSWLDHEEELRSLERELQSVTYRDQVALTARHAVRPDDLVRYVRADRPTVVHFSGHGSGDGIVFRTDEGYAEVTGESLRRFFVDRGVQLVVLNACFSRQQAKWLPGAVRAVVGTTAAVGNVAACRFTVAFYRSLGEGLSVSQAFRDGTDAVALDNRKDVFWSVGLLDDILVSRSGF